MNPNQVSSVALDLGVRVPRIRYRLIVSAMLAIIATALPLPSWASSTSAEADEVDRVLGPLALRRPLSRATITRLIKEAEGLYVAGQVGEAIAGFRTVVRVDPVNAIAWLRLGNLHHRRAEPVLAMDAYRRAASIATDEPDGGDVELQAGFKSLVNLAILHAEQMDATLTRLEAMAQPPVDVDALGRLRERHRVGQQRTQAAQTSATLRGTDPGGARAIEQRVTVAAASGQRRDGPAALPSVQYLSGAPSRPSATGRR